MVRHIVLRGFLPSAGGGTPAENLEAARQLLMALSARIPVIRDWDVRIVDRQEGPRVDLLLDSSSFASHGDLRTYQEHEEHRRVIAFLRTVHAGKAVLDYER